MENEPGLAFEINCAATSARYVSEVLSTDEEYLTFGFQSTVSAGIWMEARYCGVFLGDVISDVRRTLRSGDNLEVNLVWCSAFIFME